MRQQQWFIIIFILIQIHYVSSYYDSKINTWNVHAGEMNYPETEMIKGKTNRAISLSGGGTRAYLCALGSLKVLLDLELLQDVRYMSSVSGGSWANIAYTYFQESQTGISMNQFLGEIVDPKELTLDYLQIIDKKSARAAPVNKDMITVMVKKLATFHPLTHIWADSVSEVFLSPAGIAKHHVAGWDKEYVKDQISRNQWLNDYPFIYPCEGADECPNKPFSILNAAILGPKDAAPFLGVYYLPIEMNAIYVGSPEPHKFQYNNASRNPSEFSVGGYVETIGFGSLQYPSLKPVEKPQPFYGMGINDSSVTVNHVPVLDGPLTLSNATAISSFAPGSFLSASVFLRPLDSLIGTLVDFWSPVVENVAEPIQPKPIYVADGASLENDGFIALVRRGVTDITVFINSPVPLKPRSEFDPHERKPNRKDVDLAFSCFFGYDAEPINPIEDLKHNQIFSRKEFPGIIDAMQEAQAKGRGIVVRREHTTVKNTYWGVVGGRKLNVTWMYLSRCPVWEKQLPTETYNLVWPASDPENPAHLRESGPFKSFPHFSTSTLHYTAAQANLLTNLAGWIVQQHKDLFIQGLRGGAAAAVHLDSISEVM